MVTLILIALYGGAIGALVDALRHDELAWAEADRERGWWLTFLVMSVVIAIPTIVVVPAYVLGVRPRFSSSSSEPNPFAK